MDPDSNPDPKLDPKIFYKKVHYFQVGISWFYMIIHISHLQVVASSNNRQVVVRSVADPCLLLMDPDSNPENLLRTLFVAKSRTKREVLASF